MLSVDIILYQVRVAHMDVDTQQEEPQLEIKTLFIKNLNDKVNHERLRKNLYLLFSTYGHVVKIHTARLRGHAFITFGNAENALDAQNKLDKHVMFNKPLHIEVAKEQTRTIPLEI